MESKNKFKQRLKELREEHKLSQAGLAKELKISQAAVSQWESGERSPSLDCVIMLATYFKCSTDYLIGVSEF